jgi:GrpB-like predicted nucleotidyltransferase (UPF0157 family)
MMEPESPHWEARIAFRDYLRRNAETCAEYERLKFHLAEQFRNDREATPTAKASSWIGLS